MIELLDTIKAPQLPADNADRILRCRDALESAFEALAIEAEQAGWSGDESGIALFLIAVEHMKIREANRRMDCEIQRANVAVGRQFIHG
jgi:hypothetical protein